MKMIEFDVTVYPFKTMEEIEAMTPEEYSEFLAWGEPEEADGYTE
jgi:hypothetical protein